MTVEAWAWTLSLVFIILGVADAWRKGYLKAPDKYGHFLRPRDPRDTKSWAEFMASRRLYQSVIPFVFCVAVGLLIWALFLS